MPREIRHPEKEGIWVKPEELLEELQEKAKSGSLTEGQQDLLKELSEKKKEQEMREKEGQLKELRREEKEKATGPYL